MKNTKLVIIGFALTLFSFTVFLSACKKDTAVTGSQRLSLYLTDLPATFDSVLIDIQRVEVKIDTSDEHRHDDDFGDIDIDSDDDHHESDLFGHWEVLSMAPGVYNISKLRNGVDMLLASGSITGKIRKIRITLGTNNTLYLGGVSQSISLLPGTNNFLYIKIHGEDESGEHESGDDDVRSGSPLGVWIDFDISRSIVLIGGQYYLKPVLKPFCDAKFGSVEGKVHPKEAKALVTIFNATDTAMAMPERDDDGGYKIRGLNAGTYSLSFKGFNGYNDTTINNIVVVKGEDTHVSAITLHK